MNRAPRVLVSGVVLGQPVGGVRRHASQLIPLAARELERRGGSLSILEGERPVPFPLPDEVERLASRVPFQPPARRWWYERRALRRAIRTARQAGRPYSLWCTGHLPVPRAPLPFALTLHDLRDLAPTAPGGPRRWVAPHVLRDAVRRAGVVVTVSEAVREELERRYESARVVVVPNAGDHLAVLPRAPGEDAHLLHVGHLERRKNVELLLRALAQDPSLPDLDLAGADHGDGPRLRRLASELGVTDRVCWLGAVSDERLTELYARAGAVVVPSTLEGFGIGVLEAQLAGAPLAVSTTPALTEVAGRSVPSFAPHDPTDATRAIHAALGSTDAELRRHAEHAKRFRWEESAGRLVDAWCEAAASS